MEREIKLKVSNVRKAYKSADEVEKKLIANLCGKEYENIFSMSPLERLRTVEDCLEETGNPAVPSFDCVPEKWRQHFQDYYTALVVVEAYNEGGRMDVYSREDRYYPCFLHGGSPSAFRFNDTNYDNTNANAGSRSRQCFTIIKKAKALI